MLPPRWSQLQSDKRFAILSTLEKYILVSEDQPEQRSVGSAQYFRFSNLFRLRSLVSSFFFKRWCLPRLFSVILTELYKSFISDRSIGHLCFLQ